MLVDNDGTAAVVNLADSEDLAFLVDFNSSGAAFAADSTTSSTSASGNRNANNDEDFDDCECDYNADTEDEHDDHNYDYENKYCPVIYNDEQHTFDQVINTIIKVFKCDQMSASNLVTNIDREGRAVFESCSMQKCNEINKDIERYVARQGIRPLKVEIVSSEVIVNQNFAMQLLEWLSVFLNNGEVFRKLFTKIITEPELNLLSSILLSDSHMWKSARAHFHRLIITGLLKEYEFKKTFADSFIKHYTNMIEGYLNDDQDQMYSAISLSVQIFTVPTIAHYLIAEKDALLILLKTFYDTYATRINSRGKFEFDRSHSNMPMKRAQCILTDVKYLIKLLPTVWTDSLRTNYLNGFRKLLQLLSAIQGMDQLVRQTGQHMEFEPEWEPAFNLHVRLAKVLPLFIEWCGSDRQILVRSYNELVQNLIKTMPTEWFEKYTVAQLGNVYAQCIDYHVAVQPVSIHLPLSRLFAGLYLHLHKYQLTFESSDIAQNDKLTPVHLMEAVLETQVMIAQVHAGLWRRNGYSLTNQLYFYQIPKFRSEMLDRDIMMLQICASLMNANEFMLNVLNKFTLLPWLSSEFPANMQSPVSSSGTGTGTAPVIGAGSGTTETTDNSSNENTVPVQTSTLARIHQIFSANEDSLKNLIDVIEEFLKLIIIVIGERHVPGISYVTEADRMKKELIQQLCVKSLAHSEVYRSSVDDLVDDTQFETVISEIANFKEPKSLTSNKGGVYELKDEYYDHFNVFYYHYFKEDFSKSEVQIRKRRQAKNELECCPPPKLPQLRPEFKNLVCLLDCDVTMQLLKTVMERTLDLQARDFSELQVHMVLHLIGYGLLEEQSGFYPGFQFVQKARQFGIFDMLRKLVDFKRVEIHRGLCLWLLEKYREVARDIDGQACEQTDTEKGLNAMETECESTTGNDDVSNKSSVAGPSGEQQSSAAEARAKIVAESRARIMAQFKAMQNRFMNDNQNLLDENAHESSNASDKLSTTSPVAYNFDSDANDFPVALGPHKTPSLKDDPVLQCILCQEEHRNNGENSELVFAAFVQQSTVLSKNRKCKDTHEAQKPHVLTSVMHRVPHTNTCGHIMHYRCWKLHFDNLVYKENRRSYRLRQVSSFNLEKREFLCPLCECLSNTIMPIVPSLADMELLPSLSCGSLKIWLDIMRNEFDQFELTINSELDDIKQKYDNFEMKPNLKLTYNLAENVQIYGNTVLMVGLEKTTMEKSAPIDPRTPLLIWKSCAYTIHSFEALLRHSKKSLMGDWSTRQKDCMENVIKVSRICASAFLTNDRKILNRYNIYNIPILYNYLALLFRSDGLCVSRDTSNDEPSLSFLEYDSFGFLVAFQFLSNTFMGTNLTDNWLLKLMLVKQIVYILVVTELPEVMNCDDEDENENENRSQSQHSLTGFESIRHLLAMIHNHRKKESPLNFQTVDFMHLQEILKLNLRPFLRASALFYKFLNNIPIPEPFLEVDADHFDNLCQFLGIEPDFDKIIENDVFPLVETWLCHKFVRDYFDQKVDMNMVPKNLIEINHLIELPEDFTELISKVSTFTCPRNKYENSRTPTMCLVCGEILCSQSYCCQSRSSVVKEGVGACTKHSLDCGAGSGLFLRIRDCELIILSNITRGCYQVPPYLDEYSEPDQGLVRGYPLKLCRQNYERYNLLWFNHALHEEVTRVIESTVNYLQNPWHNL